MATIKVLHVYKTAQPITYGGVESVIYSLTDNLNNKQISSDVICTGKRFQKLPYGKVKITICSKNFEIASCPFSFSMFFNFKKFIKEYDIIHYHYPWPFADILHLLFTRNKKTVVTYHSDIVKQKLLQYIYRPFESLFLRTVNKIVATSPQYSQGSYNLQKFRNKVSIIPLGIMPLKKVQPIKHLKKILSKDYFVFVGVLRYYKGLHIAFKAIENTNHKLVIVGDGPMKEKLVSLAKELKVEKNILFLGKLNNEEKIFVIQESIGLILPSHLRSEAFGVSLLEAASLGKPLISCKIGTGTEYANMDNQTGYCVAPTPTAIRYALDNLTDKKSASSMGKQAKKRFEKYFTIDIMAQQYLKLYKELCSQK